MIANLISYFISSRLQKEPIYEALMHQDGIHLPRAPREREPSTLVSHGLRQPARIIQSTEQVGEVLMDLPPGDDAWPVVDKNGLLGIVTRSQLQEAMQKGRQRQIIAAFFKPLDPDSIPPPEAFPHLHPDQPLYLALRTLARSSLNLIPVVSRTKPRELLGVINLNDTVAAYKLDKNGESGSTADQKTRTSSAAIGGIAAVLILAIAIAGFLSYFYRSQRVAQAEQYVTSGNELIRKGNYQEAVEKFRSALSISHSSGDRLALAMALIKAKRWNEAEIYFNELIREFPDSGQSNLGLGQIALNRDDFQSAIYYYHKSIYGNWPDKSPNRGVQIRIELVESLGQEGQLTQARAELMALMTECPDIATIQKRVAHLLLNYGLSEESAQMYRQIIGKSPQDAEAYAGLGQAEFLLENFLSAQEALRNALSLNPDDARSMKQLNLAEQILELDQSLRRLRASDRYLRSRKLIEATLSSLDQCLLEEMNPLPDPAVKVIEAARDSAATRRKPHSYNDATETNLGLAEQIWEVRMNSCGPLKAEEESLRILIPRLYK